MSEPQPNPVFVRQIVATLRYWQAHTRKLDDKAIACLDAERQNLYRAVQYGLVLPETWQETAVVIHQSFSLIERRAYWREWIPVLNKVIAGCPPDQPLLQARLLNQLGELYCRNHELEQSLVVHEEAGELARRCQDERLIAETNAHLSETYFRRNELEKAEAYGQQALAALTQVSDAEERVAALMQTLGNVARARRNGALAENRLEEVVQLRRNQGASLLLARALNDLGMAYRLSGKQSAASQALLEAESLLTSSLYELDKSRNRVNIGCLYYDIGHWTKAELYFREADSIYLRQFANAEFQGRVLHHVGNALLRQAKYEEAISYFERAVVLWSQAGEEIELANTLDSLGEAKEGLGENKGALCDYRRAVELLEKYRDHERANYLLAEISKRQIFLTSK